MQLAPAMADAPSANEGDVIPGRIRWVGEDNAVGDSSVVRDSKAVGDAKAVGDSKAVGDANAVGEEAWIECTFEARAVSNAEVPIAW